MIDRSTIEAKAQELDEALTQTRDSVQNSTILYGVAMVVVVVLAFWLGRRRSKSAKTVVEVYRLK